MNASGQGGSIRPARRVLSERRQSSSKQIFDADAHELLASQGDHGINAHGAAGREVTGNH